MDYSLRSGREYLKPLPGESQIAFTLRCAAHMVYLSRDSRKLPLKPEHILEIEQEVQKAWERAEYLKEIKEGERKRRKMNIYISRGVIRNYKKGKLFDIRALPELSEELTNALAVITRELASNKVKGGLFDYMSQEIAEAYLGRVIEHKGNQVNKQGYVSMDTFKELSTLAASDFLHLLIQQAQEQGNT